MTQPWYLENGDEAVKLFPNQGMHDVARVLASAHPYAIDYLRTAPVIAVAATNGRHIRHNRERAFLVWQMKAMAEKGTKLRDVMREYRVAYQLRQIQGKVLEPSMWAPIELLSELSPSDLAQLIPATSQRMWLRNLRQWSTACMRLWGRMDAENDLASVHQRRRHLFLWAARNVGKLRSSEVDDMVDFAVRGGFNQKWSLHQATAAMMRWHAELREDDDDTRNFLTKHGIGFDDEIPYQGLPVRWTSSKGLTVVALRSAKALWLEGKAMHHCVASYIDMVLMGRSRIYSIRDGDKRLATFELQQTGWRAVRLPMPILPPLDDEPLKVTFQRAPTWNAAQIRGPCNRLATREAIAAYNEFIQAVNGR